MLQQLIDRLKQSLSRYLEPIECFVNYHLQRVYTIDPILNNEDNSKAKNINFDTTDSTIIDCEYDEKSTSSQPTNNGKSYKFVYILRILVCLWIFFELLRIVVEYFMYKPKKLVLKWKEYGSVLIIDSIDGEDQVFSREVIDMLPTSTVFNDDIEISDLKTTLTDFKEENSESQSCSLTTKLPETKVVMGPSKLSRIPQKRLNWQSAPLIESQNLTQMSLNFREKYEAELNEMAIYRHRYTHLNILLSRLACRMRSDIMKIKDDINRLQSLYNRMRQKTTRSQDKKYLADLDDFHKRTVLDLIDAMTIEESKEGKDTSNYNLIPKIIASEQKRIQRLYSRKGTECRYLKDLLFEIKENLNSFETFQNVGSCDFLWFYVQNSEKFWFFEISTQLKLYSLMSRRTFIATQRHHKLFQKFMAKYANWGILTDDHYSKQMTSQSFLYSQDERPRAETIDMLKSHVFKNSDQKRR